MYCPKCGREFKDSEQYCEACGNPRTIQNNDTVGTTKKNKTIFIIIPIVIIIVIMVMSIIISVFFSGDVFRYSDKSYLKAALKDDNCTGNGCLSSDDLELISSEEVEGDEGRTVIRKEYRVKDTNYTFFVKPQYVCQSKFFCLKNCSCNYKAWELISTYRQGLHDFTIKEYNKTINYDDRYCGNGSEEYKYKNLEVTKYDISGLVTYLEGYMEYANKLNKNERQLFYKNDDFTIKIGEKYLDLYIKNEAGKSSYSFVDKYKPADGKLETYFNNFINYNS